MQLLCECVAESRTYARGSASCLPDAGVLTCWLRRTIVARRLVPFKIGARNQMDEATILMSVGLFCIVAGAGIAAYRIRFTEPIGSVRMGIPMTLNQWRIRTASPGIALACVGLFLAVIAMLTAAIPN
jgi:hypothetical protein